MPMIETFSPVLPNAFFGTLSGPLSNNSGGSAAASPTRPAPASPACRKSRRSGPPGSCAALIASSPLPTPHPDPPPQRGEGTGGLLLLGPGFLELLLGPGFLEHLLDFLLLGVQREAVRLPRLGVV